MERRAYRMAQMATGNAEDALDIVQDAMLRLVQKYAHRPDSEWGALFHRILQSRITDWYRRQAIRNRCRVWLKQDRIDETEPPEAMAGLSDPAGRSPEQQLFNQQAMETLQQALQQLPMRQRQTFLLRCWEGLDVNQTAAAIGCSAGSVKTHYHRALNTLREKLGDNWP